MIDEDDGESREESDATDEERERISKRERSAAQRKMRKRQAAATAGRAVLKNHCYNGTKCDAYLAIEKREKGTDKLKGDIEYLPNSM